MTTINYKESAITGTQWSRCKEVNITNPLNAQPMITLAEEVVVQIPGIDNHFVTANFNFKTPFDPAINIQLRNPDTDELTGGTITQGQMYVFLYSLYRMVSDKGHAETPEDGTRPMLQEVILQNP